MERCARKDRIQRDAKTRESERPPTVSCYTPRAQAPRTGRRGGSNHSASSLKGTASQISPNLARCRAGSPGRFRNPNSAPARRREFGGAAGGTSLGPTPLLVGRFRPNFGRLLLGPQSSPNFRLPISPPIFALPSWICRQEVVTDRLDEMTAKLSGTGEASRSLVPPLRKTPASHLPILAAGRRGVERLGTSGGAGS